MKHTAAWYQATDGEGNNTDFAVAPVVGLYEEPPEEPLSLGALTYSVGEKADPSAPLTGIALVRAKIDGSGGVESHFWSKSPSAVPEINIAGAGLALALLGGIVSIQRERRLAK